MTKVLITGFEPFDKDSINPSYEAVKRVSNINKEIILRKLLLPTVFYGSAEVLENEIKIFKPDIVINVGLSKGSRFVSVERVAINIDDARINDNDGKKPVDEKIQKDGENAYFSSLPIKRIVKALNENGLEASVSNSAGTFVCNHIMYTSLYLSKKYYGFKTGFIHLPSLDTMTNDKNMYTMTLEEMVRALEIVINTAVEYKDDVDVNLSDVRLY